MVETTVVVVVVVVIVVVVVPIGDSTCNDIRRCSVTEQAVGKRWALLRRARLSGGGLNVALTG